MTWTCPDCGKEFRNTKQWHSCAKVGVEAHLQGKSTAVCAIVDTLINEFEPRDGVTINPVW